MREHERIICFLNELDFVLLLFLVAGSCSLVPRAGLNGSGLGEVFREKRDERSAVSTLNNLSKLSGMFHHFVQMACPRVHAQSESAWTLKVSLDPNSIFFGPHVVTPHLVHAVKELQEDGCEAAALAAGAQVAALAELVAKGEPLFLQQHLETLQSPVERITEQLHQGHHLQTRKQQRSSELQNLECVTSTLR